MTSSPFIGFTLLSATVMQLLVPRKQRLPRPGRRQAAGFGFRNEAPSYMEAL